MQRLGLNSDNAVTAKGLIINHRQYIPPYHHIKGTQPSNYDKAALVICNGVAQSV
jgi:hypothetical protein